jgi:hypothetical protein
MTQRAGRGARLHKATVVTEEEEEEEEEGFEAWYEA